MNQYHIDMHPTLCQNPFCPQEHEGSGDKARQRFQERNDQEPIGQIGFGLTGDGIEPGINLGSGLTMSFDGDIGFKLF